MDQDHHIAPIKERAETTSYNLGGYNKDKPPLLKKLYEQPGMDKALPIGLAPVLLGE